MAAISATPTATSSLPAAVGAVRLEQARREADQAEAFAQTLRARADAAEVDASTSQVRVRDLSNSAQQIDPTYKSQLQTSGSEVAPQTQAILVGLYSATSNQRIASGNALKTDANAQAVINAQGQTTGRIVNLRA